MRSGTVRFASQLPRKHRGVRSDTDKPRPPYCFRIFTANAPSAKGVHHPKISGRSSASTWSCKYFFQVLEIPHGDLLRSAPAGGVDAVS